MSVCSLYFKFAINLIHEDIKKLKIFKNELRDIFLIFAVFEIFILYYFKFYHIIMRYICKNFLTIEICFNRKIRVIFLRYVFF